jgi:hypothetical protein
MKSMIKKQNFGKSAKHNSLSLKTVLAGLQRDAENQTKYKINRGLT